MIWQTRVQCLMWSEGLPRSKLTLGLLLMSEPPRNSSATDPCMGTRKSTQVFPPSSER